MKVSSPDKVMFPDARITKGELVAYYRDVAPMMVPHLRGRPVTMERYPEGIGFGGFMQKDAPDYFPEWVRRVTVPKKKGTVDHVVCDDARTLLYLANQNCVTPHVWTSREPHLDRPDMLLFDLDPAGDDFPLVRRTALELRGLLDELRLMSFVKTSGSRGLHVAVLRDVADFDEAGALAHEIGGELVSRAPDRLTMEGSKAKRQGRLYVDTGRNAYGQMVAAVYAVRARPGAPVSMPVSWDEVEDDRLDPQRFTLGTARERLDRVGSLYWPGT